MDPKYHNQDQNPLVWHRAQRMNKKILFAPKFIICLSKKGQQVDVNK